MKKSLLLIPLLLSLFITGCYDYEEINTRAMVIGVAFDKEGDEYIVSVQVLYIEPQSKEGTTAGTQPTLYTGRGKSIDGALSQISLVSPRYLCFTHIQLVVIQETIAKEGVMSVLDFFMRHYESRQQFYVVISKEKTAKDILMIHTVLETFPTFNIIKSLDIKNIDHGLSNAITYDNLLSIIIKDGIHPLVPGIEIIGSVEQGKKKETTEEMEPPTQIMVSTLGIFKEDRLLDWLNIDESWGYNFAMGNIKEKVLEFPCDDKNYSASLITGVKPNNKVKIDDDKITAEITVNITGRISEVNCDIYLDNPKNIELLTSKASKEVERLIQTAITKSKELNTDIFGVERMVYQTDYKHWKKIKEKWDEIYPEIEFKVKVNTTLLRRGLLDDTIFKGDLSE
ncbi:MAG: Ger(x)C family spore germination protein [Bacilli bacterium]|nr:Ger(x)C family spore germination protein [Bacilli bacterium]